MLACIKFAPVLLSGNAFIWKPSPYAPYCSPKVAERDIHFFPPSVFRALSGDDLLSLLLSEDLAVDMVNFTGSARTGKKIMSSCSKSMKRLTLELSGNDAAIVCADVEPRRCRDQDRIHRFLHAGPDLHDDKTAVRPRSGLWRRTRGHGRLRTERHARRFRGRPHGPGIQQAAV